MKLIPQLTHNTLPNTFSYGDKHYLVVTTILYMDISTQDVLKMDKLWSETQSLLGEGRPLDIYGPKPNGEVIIYGNCYSKAPTTVKEVGFKLQGNGVDLNKQLTVIGDRTLHKKLFSYTISEPKPFTQMKVGYENAYGGETFKKNPIGKGFEPSLKYNQTLLMHNIDVKEDPIVDYKQDSFTPYAFESKGTHWKGRVEKMGTYDEHWRNNYSPYYAPDIDMSFFNTVDRDQQIEGYFKGDESFEVYNMHPQKETVMGQLPNRSVKTFITKITENEEKFMELDTSLDTVVIFPEIERVAMIYRAMIEVQDDDYPEILTLFTLDEPLDEPEHDLEYYKEIYEKKLDDPLDIKEQVKQASENFPNTPSIPVKDFAFVSEMVLRINLKELPHIFPSSKGVKSLQTQYAKCIDRYLERDDLSSRHIESLKQLKKLTNPNYIVDSHRQQIDMLQVKHKDFIDETIEKNQKKYPNSNIRKEFEQQVNSIKYSDQLKQLEEKGYESLLIYNWSDGARFFLGDSNVLLKQSIKRCEVLGRFGLYEVVIHHLLHIGYNDEIRYINSKQWIDNDEAIEMGVGYVIGYFDQDQVKRLAIRERLFDKEDNYLGDQHDQIVKGSRTVDLFLRGRCCEYIILVPEILEAYLMFQDFWTFCSVMVVKDEESFFKSDYYTKNSSTIDLIFTTTFAINSNDVKTYHLDMDSVYKAYHSQRDLEKEMLEQLPDTPYSQEMRREYKKKKRQGKNYATPLDIKDHERRIVNAVENKIDGSTNDEMFKGLSSDEKRDMLNMIQDYKKKAFNNEMDIKNKDDMYTYAKSMFKEAYKKYPEKETKRAISRLTSYLENDRILSKQDKSDSSDKASNVMKKMFKRYFDKDMSKRSQKFNSQDDLLLTYSNTVELQGAFMLMDELEEIVFENVNFKQTQWVGVRLKQVCFVKCNFSKSQFKDSVLEECKFESCTMDDVAWMSTDISNSLFKSSQAHNSVYQGVELQGITLDEYSLERSIFTDCDWKEMHAINVNFDHSTITNLIIDQSEFSLTTFKDSMWLDTIIKHTLFEKVDLFKMVSLSTQLEHCQFKEVLSQRLLLLKGTEVAYCDFKSTDFDDVSFQEGIFKEIDFSHCSMNGSRLYQSVFKECNFFSIDAKESDFQKSEFYNCDMRFLNLMKGSLRKAYLIESVLDDSNLYECLIFNTKFNETSLLNCNLDNTNLENGKERYIYEA